MFVRTLNIQVPYPIQFSDNPNTIELYPILTNEQFAYEFAKSKKLIYNSIICNCGRIMQIQKNNSFKCCECFACKCGMKASIFTFSYFMYSKISINIEMHIIYCWALEYSVKNAFAEIQIGYNTISSRFKQLREACLGYLSGQNQPVIGGKNKTVEIDESLLYNSSCNRDDGKITLTNKGDGSVASMDLKTGEADKALAPSADAHRSVYLAYPSFNYIIHNTSSEVAAVSRLGKNMKPLLDDFAQICGPKVKIASIDKCAKALKGKNAVLVKDLGALCCGAVEGDAQAVDMIMSKSCLTLLGTKIFGKAKAINPVEALLMRVVYLTKYSKQASK